jgi:hypothetical protein
MGSETAIPRGGAIAEADKNGLEAYRQAASLLKAR